MSAAAIGRLTHAPVIADGQVDDLQAEACRSEKQVEIADRIKLSRVVATKVVRSLRIRCSGSFRAGTESRCGRTTGQSVSDRQMGGRESQPDRRCRATLVETSD